MRIFLNFVTAKQLIYVVEYQKYALEINICEKTCNQC